MTRILAALVFTPAMLGLIWLGGHALAATCFTLGLLMLWEYAGMVFAPDERVAKGLSYVAGSLIGAATLGWLPAAAGATLLPGLTLLGLCAVLMRPEPLPSSVQRVALALFGAAYAAGLITLLARLRGCRADGLGLCLLALLCTWGADTGAYFAGRLFGRRKLYPKISPGKTVEGALGGLVCALAIAPAVRTVFAVALPLGHTLALGALSAGFGMLGDLSESMLKRSVGAKDSSRLIPGHGGVLDRFDGVMFAVPACYLYLAACIGL